jgi:hypothetical protein
MNGKNDQHTQMTLTDAAMSLGYIPQANLFERQPISFAQSALKIALEKVMDFYALVHPQMVLPCVLVGGGSLLWDRLPEGWTRSPEAPIANAYGATLAEAGITYNCLTDLDKKHTALDTIYEQAFQKIIAKGVNAPYVKSVDIIPYHYMSGNKARVIVRVAGNIAPMHYAQIDRQLYETQDVN